MFGGHGIAGTGQFFEAIGFRPGRVMAAIAGLGELGAGLAFALGLLTPFASAVIIATMAVAIWSVHLDKGFFNQNGGYELPLLNAAIALGIAFTGAGPLSLDTMLGFPLSGGQWGFLALGLGLAGALPPLIVRAMAVGHQNA
jgi:putative oxidoreductase